MKIRCIASIISAVLMGILASSCVTFYQDPYAAPDDRRDDAADNCVAPDNVAVGAWWLETVYIESTPAETLTYAADSTPEIVSPLLTYSMGIYRNKGWCYEFAQGSRIQWSNIMVFSASGHYDSVYVCIAEDPSSGYALHTLAHENPGDDTAIDSRVWVSRTYRPYAASLPLILPSSWPVFQAEPGARKIHLTCAVIDEQNMPADSCELAISSWTQTKMLRADSLGNFSLDMPSGTWKLEPYQNAWLEMRFPPTAPAPSAVQYFGAETTIELGSVDSASITYHVLRPDTVIRGRCLNPAEFPGAMGNFYIMATSYDSTLFSCAPFDSLGNLSIPVSSGTTAYNLSARIAKRDTGVYYTLNPMSIRYVAPGDTTNDFTVVQSRW